MEATSPSIPLHSTELRWFWTQSFPSTCHQALPPCNAESRVDLYLLSRDDSVGVKLREGRFEVKKRNSRDALLAHGLVGNAERWSKWSWSGEIPGVPTSDAAGPWVAVHKERRQWRFELGERGATLTAKAHVPRGGALELTRLAIRGEASWSVALEWFTEEHDHALLADCAQSLLAPLALPPLRLEDSGGYPMWLLSRCKDG